VLLDKVLRTWDVHGGKIDPILVIGRGFYDEIFFYSFKTYLTELFVLTLVLILVQGKSKNDIHKTIHKTRQGLLHGKTRKYQLVTHDP
jgi:hypothetical protein